MFNTIFRFSPFLHTSYFVLEKSIVLIKYLHGEAKRPNLMIIEKDSRRKNRFGRINFKKISKFIGIGDCRLTLRML